MSSRLWETLKLEPSEEEVYKSCCNQDLWTLDEFCALMVGLTPKRLSDIGKKQGELPNPKELRQAIQALNLSTRLLAEVQKDGKDGLRLIKNEFYMSSWRYIKWVSLNEIPINNKFFENMPLILMELFFEFRPINVALRTKSKYCREYHEALYLRHAEELIKNTPKRLTRKEIYKHPRMQNVLHDLKDHAGSPVRYRKRTITDSWLKKIDKQPRGRPKIEY